MIKLLWMVSSADVVEINQSMQPKISWGEKVQLGGGVKAQRTSKLLLILLLRLGVRFFGEARDRCRDCLFSCFAVPMHLRRSAVFGSQCSFRRWCRPSKSKIGSS